MEPPVTSKTQSTEDPDRLIKRANRLRQVVQGVMDPKAVEEIERFISDLDARADVLTPH